METGAIRAICFDLDNTLWHIEPVLMRAERILADWLDRRYPKIPAAFGPADVLAVRAALVAERPELAHDFTFLRRETLVRVAMAVGYDRDSARGISAAAFTLWHEARNQVTPYDEVVPSLERLRLHFRLATLSNGNADLERIGLAHHFEVRLHAAALGCAKPDLRAYTQLADALTLERANTVCRR